MYWFQLWREYKLSLAELIAAFPEMQIIYSDKSVAIVENISQKQLLEKATFLGGTIKIMKVDALGWQSFEQYILTQAASHQWKFHYWLSILWFNKSLKKELLTLKKILKASWVSSRFVNKDFKNVNTAQILWEKLVQRSTDFTFINAVWGCIWTTIWIQDIAAYSQRDYSKKRDMQVGMLPPKLCQIMLNLWLPFCTWWRERTCSVYDPFVGLWTLLIEAKLMWFTDLYGSDISQQMVETASQNVGSSLGSIEKLNAKFIHEVSFWEQVKDWMIVTEWFLWEIMTQKNISKERIQVQRDSLTKLYKAFFTHLQKWRFTWTLVMSFPFWEIKWKYQFFEEVYTVLDSYCEILPFFSEDFSQHPTKVWSLLYKREKQLVGREIFILKMK